MFSAIRNRTLTAVLKSHTGKRLLAAVASAAPQNHNAKLVQQWLVPESPSQGSSSSADPLAFDTLEVKKQNGVYRVNLNRPKKGNAFNMQMWEDLEQCFKIIDYSKDARAVILGGNGKYFNTGMDLDVFAQMGVALTRISCEGRKREALHKIIKKFQNVVSAPEKCRVPVIAAIHGPCIGGGVDLVTSCDMILCGSEATFSVKEIDLAIVADIGTLQRLPRHVGQQRSRELAFTGRTISASEAKDYGLALEVLESTDALNVRADELASEIASKSPVTIRGVKQVLNYQIDHTTEDSLDQVAMWNTAMLYTEDLDEALSATMSRRTPKYQD